MCNAVDEKWTPKFTTTVRPLADLLEEVYARAGKRTKRAIALIRLEGLSSKDLTKTFKD